LLVFLFSSSRFFASRVCFSMITHPSDIGLSCTSSAFASRSVSSSALHLLFLTKLLVRKSHLFFAFLHSGYVFCFRTFHHSCERALQLHMADGVGCVRISPCPAVGPGTSLPKEPSFPRGSSPKMFECLKGDKNSQQFVDSVLAMAVTTSEANHNGRMLLCRQGPPPPLTSLVIQCSCGYLF